MKYSFIVCCYNGEKYVDTCIQSILNQTYKNYEIIIVNDGSTDNSLKIINKYKSKNVRIINQENKGLSYSRNIAIKESTGDYFLFVDIDDYIREDLLYIINKCNNKNIELIKFNYIMVYNDREEIKETSYSNALIDGDTALKILIEDKNGFEMANLYCYNKEYFVRNNYSYEIGKYHEDFGLTPYVILKAKTVLLLNEPLYYYFQSDNSITRVNDDKKSIKKADDVLFFFNKYKDIVENSLFMSFMANAVIMKFDMLTNSYKKEYAVKIHESKVIDYLKSDNYKRLLKKIIYKFRIKKYL